MNLRHINSPPYNPNVIQVRGIFPAPPIIPQYNNYDKECKDECLDKNSQEDLLICGKCEGDRYPKINPDNPEEYLCCADSEAVFCKEGYDSEAECCSGACINGKCCAKPVKYEHKGALSEDDFGNEYHLICCEQGNRDEKCDQCPEGKFPKYNEDNPEQPLCCKDENAIICNNDCCTGECLTPSDYSSDYVCCSGDKICNENCCGAGEFCDRHIVGNEYCKKIEYTNCIKSEIDDYGNEIDEIGEVYYQTDPDGMSSSLACCYGKVSKNFFIPASDGQVYLHQACCKEDEEIVVSSFGKYGCCKKENTRTVINYGTDQETVFEGELDPNADYINVCCAPGEEIISKICVEECAGRGGKPYIAKGGVHCCENGTVVINPEEPLPPVIKNRFPPENKLDNFQVCCPYDESIENIPLCQNACKEKGGKLFHDINNREQITCCEDESLLQTVDLVGEDGVPYGVCCKEKGEELAFINELELACCKKEYTYSPKHIDSAEATIKFCCPPSDIMDVGNSTGRVCALQCIEKGGRVYVTKDDNNPEIVKCCESGAVVLDLSLALPEALKVKYKVDNYMRCCTEEEMGEENGSCQNSCEQLNGQLYYDILNKSGSPIKCCVDGGSWKFSAIQDEYGTQKLPLGACCMSFQVYDKTKKECTSCEEAGGKKYHDKNDPDGMIKCCEKEDTPYTIDQESDDDIPYGVCCKPGQRFINNNCEDSVSSTPTNIVSPTISGYPTPKPSPSVSTSDGLTETPLESESQYDGYSNESTVPSQTSAGVNNCGPTQRKYFRSSDWTQACCPTDPNGTGEFCQDPYKANGVGDCCENGAHCSNDGICVKRLPPVTDESAGPSQSSSDGTSDESPYPSQSPNGSSSGGINDTISGDPTSTDTIGDPFSLDYLYNQH